MKNKVRALLFVFLYFWNKIENVKIKM